MSGTLQQGKIDAARLQTTGNFERGDFPLAMPLGIVAHISSNTRTHPLRQKWSSDVPERKSQLGAITKRKQAFPLGVVERVEQAGAFTGILQRLKQSRCIAGQAGRH